MKRLLATLLATLTALLLVVSAIGCSGFAAERERLEKVEEKLAQQTEVIKTLVPIVARQQAELEAAQKLQDAASQQITAGRRVIRDIWDQLAQLADPVPPRYREPEDKAK